MRTLTPELQAELASGSPRIARLIKLKFKNGTERGYTDHDIPLEVGGLVHVPTPGLTSASYTSKANAEVSTQRMASGWVDVPEDELRGGLADDASIECSWVSWANPNGGKLITFQGKIGEVTWNETGFEAEIVSMMRDLERNIGWTYSSSCRHKLFSQPAPGQIGACMADPAPYTFTGTVASVITPKWKFTIAGDASGKGDAYFSAGQITFTSGLNTGLSAVVKLHSSETFELFLPTAFAIPVGTTFTVQAGCDKTAATCKAKFDNILNHGGFPHMQPNVQYR